VKYHLEPTAAWGKPTRTADFRLYNASGEVPRAVEALARGWAVVVRRRPLCVLQRVEGGWWLFFALLEAEKDLHGRACPAVALGKLDRAPPPPELVPLLERFAEACPDVLNRPLPQVVEVDPADSAPQTGPTEDVAVAALALVTGHPAAICPDGRTAAVLRAVSLDGLAWACRAWADLPNHGLPSGPGLFVTEQPEQFRALPAVAAAAAPGPQAVLGLNLSALSGLPEPAELRVQLARAALGLKAGLPDEQLSLGALQWLAGHPVSRKAAFACVAPALLGPFLKAQGNVSPEEVLLLRGRLRSEHADTVAGLLARSRSAGRFQAFHHIFPQEQRARLGLLEPHVRKVWEALESDSPQGPPLPQQDVTEFLDVLREVKPQLWPRPTLAGLARGVLGGHPQMRAWFAEMLRKGGLPAELVDVLLECSGPTAALPVLPPPSASLLGPDVSWLRAVNPAIFLRRCAAWLYHSAWRHWWKQGVRVLARGPGKELRADLFFAADSTGDVELLREHAPPVVAGLADPQKPAVPFPPPDWPAGANLLLQRMYEDGSLWGRIRPFAPGEALPALAWLYQALGGKAPDVAACYHDLKGQRALAPDWLRRLAPLLPRTDLLAQFAAWATRSEGPERAEALELLLGQPSLEGEQRQWLRASQGVGRLGPVPSCWGPRDLAALLPLLDPLRDVVREVFSWPVVEDAEGEALLLDRLCERLEKQRVPPPSQAPSAAQLARRPVWGARLCALPGWKGFGRVLELAAPAEGPPEENVPELIRFRPPNPPEL
jgi:hypothetical protein